jgi:prevent-host-death family protein
MKQVNIHEAKTNLSKLLERIESGEQIIIANRGVRDFSYTDASRTDVGF